MKLIAIVAGAAATVVFVLVLALTVLYAAVGWRDR